MNSGPDATSTDPFVIAGRSESGPVWPPEIDYEDADRTYTDAPAEVISGHLAAVVGGLELDAPLEKYLSKSGVDWMRSFYDRYQQERPETLDAAPVLRRTWFDGGYLPDDGPTAQQQAEHAAEFDYPDPVVLAENWKRTRAARLDRQRAARRADKETGDRLAKVGVELDAAFTVAEIERVHGGKGWAELARRAWEASVAAEDGRPTDEILTVAAAQLIRCGATPEDIAAMTPGLDTFTRAAARKEVAAVRRADQRDALAEGDRIHLRRTEGGRVAPPEVITLDDLLAEADDPVIYRVAELWPVGGRVLMAAQYKAGKSTMVGNLVRSLVDGDDFLGRFPAQPARRVVLFDTELDRRTLRRWLREQRIRNTAAVKVVPLRGKVSAFDLMDRSVRAQWAAHCAGTDVVILDCLRPVLDALGLSEDKDAGKFLVQFDAMLEEAKTEDAMVVTHMGHQGERARGDSRLLDWNDAMWTIVRDIKDPDQRFFSALGRDVALAEGALSYDEPTRHLTFEGGSRREAASNALLPDLLALLRVEPKLSGRAIEDKLCGPHASRDEVRSVVTLAKDRRLIVVEKGPRGAHLHSLREGDPIGTSGPGNGHANG